MKKLQKITTNNGTLDNGELYITTEKKEEGTMENPIIVEEEQEAKETVVAAHTANKGGISMKTCKVYNVMADKMEEVVLFSSAMMRKLESMGRMDAIIKVDGEIDSRASEEDQAVAMQRLSEIVANGYEYNGHVYRPFFAGSSDIRKSTSGWLDETLLPVMGKWAMCGLRTADLNVAVNKYMSYIGLLMSATRSFRSVYGTTLNIRRVCVVPDHEVSVTGVFDYVEGNDVYEDVKRTIKINAFDGAALIMPEITGNKASTLRMPWTKPCAFPFDFRAFAKERGRKSVIDFWGKTVDLDDVDLILTESCFKMAKQYKSWSQYCDAFEELGHEIGVCVEEHAPKAKAMPYQQLQTLGSCDHDDVLTFAAKAKKSVYKYTKAEGAAKLLGGNLAKAAALYPDLLAEPFVQNRVQEAYASKRLRIMGGKVPELGYNAFLAPDLVAMMEAILGLPVVGALKVGECSCSNCRNGDVDVTRNPHLDHAHVILVNRKKASKWFMGPTMYINIFDLTTIRLRADYDGDHVWYSQDKDLLRLVYRTNMNLDNGAIDWDAPKAPKSKINRSTIAQFVKSLTQGSQIGVYADAMTKMWNLYYEGELSDQELRYACAWLTYAGNVLIDAAKHGSANVQVPNQIKAIFKELLPEYCRYAKADSTRPIDDPVWDTKCTRRDSFADQYSKAAEENIPEHLEIEGSSNFVFDPSVLMIDPHRKSGGLTGLCVMGTLNAEKMKYENEGIFQEIAFRHADEWGELQKNADNLNKRQTWEEVRGKAAFEEIKAWAEAHGSTVEAAYDVICRWVFNKKMSEGYALAIKSAFWRIFGEMAVSTLEKNLQKYNISDEELLDDDWMEDEEE